MRTKTGPAGRLFVCLLFIAFFAISILPAAPQDQPSAGSVGLNGRRITLDVVVTDKSGKAVPGLQQSDFTLLDNKQPQPIAAFQAVDGTAASGDTATQIVLLFDAFNTSTETLTYARLQLAKFVGRVSGQLALPVELSFFADSGVIHTKPTRDPAALLANFDQNVGATRALRSAGLRHAPEDAVRGSVDVVAHFIVDAVNQPGRKMFIWVSPGWPILAGAVAMTDNIKRGLFDNIVTLSMQLREARVVLYSAEALGTGTNVSNNDAIGRSMGSLAASPAASGNTLASMQYDQFLAPVKTYRDAEQSNMALQVLASQTGGLVLGSGNDIAGEIEKCLADGPTSYVISFDAPPARAANEYHPLQIKLMKPGLTARTRTGYYDQP